MDLRQDLVMRFLNRKMEPGKSDEVKDLIYLLETEYEGFTDRDLSVLPSEPHRPRWHRIVTNAVRLSPGRIDYEGNDWENLRTKRPGKTYEYYLSEKDPVEDLLAEGKSDDNGSGYVYGIINPSWHGWVKIGMTVDIEKRLSAYQTYTPTKDFEVLCKTFVENRRSGEGRAHFLASTKAEECSGEWFKIKSEDACTIIAGLQPSI